MKKFAIALIVIAALPYLFKLNGTNKQASTNVSWVLDAWASRDSTLGDTTVFKASKKILPRSGVVIGAPYAPRNNFPGGRVDSLYVNHLNVSSVVSQIGSATAAAGVDSNLILDGGVSGSDLAGTLNGNKTFPGVITSAGPGASFAAGTITVSTGGSLTSTAAGATTALGTTTVTSGFTAAGLVDSTDISTVGSSNIPGTISGTHIFSGALSSAGAGATFSAGTASVTNFPNSIYVNKSATNTKSTIGVTINQAENDNEALTIKSSDVAHGITDLTETDTWAAFEKLDIGSGGAIFLGVNGATTAAQVYGVGVTDNTTKSTAGRGYVELVASKKSGTSTAIPGADANLLVIKAHTTTRFIFDQEGTAHADDVWSDNAFDLAESYDVVKPDSSAMPAYWRIQKAIDSTKSVPVYSIEGAVVTIDTTTDNKFTLSSSVYQVVTGVISYHTAQLNNVFGDLTKKYPQLQLSDYANPMPVGLVGLIPTKVCGENGAIKRGDILVTSSKRGVAMKGDPLAASANPRYCVGVAMMNFPYASSDSVGVINVQR